MTKALDPVTLEVIRNRLEMFAEEMQAALIRSAHSSIVREASDASSAILDAQGNLISQARGVPVHLGSIDSAVKSVCRAFPAQDMRDGDIYIVNDPYEDAQHLSDVVILTPVVIQGRTLALTACMAHQQDIGGMSPGSMPQNATELYQEGMIIPPLMLYTAGEPNHTLFSMIKKNVRIPDTVVGDIGAQIACVKTGKRRMLGLFSEYGTDQLFEAIAIQQDKAEMLTRNFIEQMPNGRYSFEDYLDNDGVDLEKRVRIVATVNINDSDFVVDFTGSDPQVRGPINAMPSVAVSAVRYVIRAVTDPEIPNNAGCYRPIRVITPEGSVVNPYHPAPVSNRGVTLRRMIDCVMGALVQVIPERVTAANNGHPLFCSVGGTNPVTRSPYVTSILTTGGQGARPTKDGVEAVCTDASNSMNVPVEHLETYFPLRILRWNLRDDSGGAGRWRGGLGLECFVMITRGTAILSHRGERHFSAPWGLFGGKPGETCVSEVIRVSGDTQRIQSKENVLVEEGDLLRFYTTGGGGYGDPFDRSPSRVLEDVVNRKVSTRSAELDYGVVLVEGGVDEEATSNRREGLRAQRGAIAWTYDRGYT